LPVGNGGANGGGGVAIDTATGNVFFTNSLDDTVSVISGASNMVIRTLTAGDEPFGAAIDSGTRRVYVGNRGSNNLSLFMDAYTAISDVVAGSPAPQTPQPD